MIRIEGLGESQHYRAVIHYGDAYAPLTESDIDALGQCLNLSTNDFLDAFPKKVTENQYLQNRIREAIATIENRDSCTTTLKDSIKSLLDPPR